MKKALTLGTIAALALPLVSLAQVDDLADAGSLVIDIINNIIVPVLFAIAFIVFLWGAFQTFILGANNDTAKEKGKNFMLYGLIGFFVMVSVWGLVNILTNTAGLSDTSGPTGGLPDTGFDVGDN